MYCFHEPVRKRNSRHLPPVVLRSRGQLHTFQHYCPQTKPPSCALEALHSPCMYQMPHRVQEAKAWRRTHSKNDKHRHAKGNSMPTHSAAQTPMPQAQFLAAGQQQPPWAQARSGIACRSLWAQRGQSVRSSTKGHSNFPLAQTTHAWQQQPMCQGVYMSLQDPLRDTPASLSTGVTTRHG
jgi:hypothetical protein